MEPEHGESRVTWLQRNGLGPYVLQQDRNLFWSQYEGEPGRWIRVVWEGQRPMYGSPEETDEQIRARYAEAEWGRLRRWAEERAKRPNLPMMPYVPLIPPAPPVRRPAPVAPRVPVVPKMTYPEFILQETEMIRRTKPGYIGPQHPYKSPLL